MKIIDWIKHAKLADWVRLIRKLLPHVAIVISGVLIVFFLIDRVNKPMGFMTNEFHKRLTFALAILSIGLACRVISVQRRIERARRSRQAKEREEQTQRRRPQQRSFR